MEQNFDNKLHWVYLLLFPLLCVTGELLVCLVEMLAWLLEGYVDIDPLIPTWNDLIYYSCTLVFLMLCVLSNQYRIQGSVLVVKESFLGKSILDAAIPIACIDKVQRRWGLVILYVENTSFPLLCIGKSKLLYKALCAQMNSTSYAD